ncbi:MAG: ATP-dependent Clp protease proteolytic subunit [Verrucomicrobiota bacterium]
MKFRCFLPAAMVAVTLLPGCILFNHIGTESPQPPDARIDFSDPVLNQRRIVITGQITALTASSVVRQLFYLDAQNHLPIELYLMTPGGDLNAAFAIEHTMESIQSPVNTIALGECTSGGAMLLAAGTGKRSAYADAVIILHGFVVHGKMPGDAVRQYQESYTDFWERRARLPKGWVPIPQGRFYTLTPSQALEYGVIDQLIPSTGVKPGPNAAK